MLQARCVSLPTTKSPRGHRAIQIELDTSLMVSKPPVSHPEIPYSRRGSSVTLITHTRNPSHLARALYLAPQLAPHPMLSGAAAEAIGASLDVHQADPSYFWTETRWREHRRGLGLPENPVEYPRPGTPYATKSETTDIASFYDDRDKEWKPLDLMPTGTVGAVALDIRGCIATVTSTGGRTNKLAGRVGDTPVMGSGFWAEEWERDGEFVKRTGDYLRGKSAHDGVGVSCTGDGDVRSTCVDVELRSANYNFSTTSAVLRLQTSLDECNTLASRWARRPRK
jgi:beta-aspartyl-peptidase (threonine type)